MRKMLIREATNADIKQMQLVRNAVRENVLSNPALIKDEDYNAYITLRGKGWVCVVDGMVVGFSVIDLVDSNVWALFVHPDFDRKGIGRQLHDVMLTWYFAQTRHTLWLSTAPGTRAEGFYRSASWAEVGTYGKGEIKFEMGFGDWAALKTNIR